MSNKEEPILECIDLIKNYTDRAIEITVLKGVNLKIFEGELIAIIGSSGCGKTTLLNLMGGLDKPTSGQIILNGNSIETFNDEKLTEFRRKVGFVFQDFNLLPVLTAAQNVELPMIYANELLQPDRERKTRELLKKVGLGKRRKHLPVALSSGEKQRVGIARALANDPKIILADQPTGNLDSKTGLEIIELFQSLRNDLNLSIVMVTHNLEIAKKADRIMAFQNGVLIPTKIKNS